MTRESKLKQIALEYFISIVRDKYGEQVPDRFVVQEAEKMLERALED